MSLLCFVVLVLSIITFIATGEMVTGFTHEAQPNGDLVHTEPLFRLHQAAAGFGLASVLLVLSPVLGSDFPTFHMVWFTYALALLVMAFKRMWNISLWNVNTYNRKIGWLTVISLGAIVIMLIEWLAYRNPFFSLGLLIGYAPFYIVMRLHFLYVKSHLTKTKC